MIYELKEPVLGQTHIKYDDLEHRLGSSLVLSGQYGTMVKDEFVPEPRIQRVSRTISGDEYKEYIAAIEIPAEKQLEVQVDAVKPWFDKNGAIDGSITWEPVAKEAVAETAEISSAVEVKPK